MIIEVTYSEQLDVRHRVRWIALHDKVKVFENISAAGQYLAVVQDICEAADLVIEAVSIRPAVLQGHASGVNA